LRYSFGPHGVDGDDCALDGHHVQKRGNGDDLVRFSGDGDLPITARWRAAEAETMWSGSFDPLPPERREVLPSMAITTAGVLVSAETRATKQRWKACASSVAKMSPR